MKGTYLADKKHARKDTTGLNPQFVRTPAEAERAHDVMTVSLASAQSVEMSETDRDRMRTSRNILCWLLGHGSTGFEELMASLEAILAEDGIDVDRAMAELEARNRSGKKGGITN